MGRIMADVDSQANPLRQEKGTRFNSSTQRVQKFTRISMSLSIVDRQPAELLLEAVLLSPSARNRRSRSVESRRGEASEGETRMYNVQCSIVLEGDSDCVFDLQTEETRHSTQTRACRVVNSLTQVIKGSFKVEIFV